MPLGSKDLGMGFGDNPGTMNHSSIWRQRLALLMTDITRGLFLVTHSSLAMLGLAAAALVLALWWQPAWLNAAESAVFNWLRERNVLVSWLPENAAERATALDLSALPPAQAAVAEVERLKGIIRKVEWVNMTDGDGNFAYQECSECGYSREHGHHKDCPFFGWEGGE